MNWRRGLLRLWVLASVIWCALVGAYAISDWRDHQLTPTQTDDVNPFAKYVPGKTIEQGGWTITMPGTPASGTSSTVWIEVAIAIGGPVVVLLLGIALSWAAAGFAHERSN